jgi:hypothetical protein
MIQQEWTADPFDVGGLQKKLPADMKEEAASLLVVKVVQEKRQACWWLRDPADRGCYYGEEEEEEGRHSKRAGAEDAGYGEEEMA